MDCLVDGRYELAYNYLDIEELKQEWLEEWFDEETLANMENDAMAKFWQDYEGCYFDPKLGEYVYYDAK